VTTPETTKLVRTLTGLASTSADLANTALIGGPEALDPIDSTLTATEYRITQARKQLADAKTAEYNAHAAGNARIAPGLQLLRETRDEMRAALKPEPLAPSLMRAAYAAHAPAGSRYFPGADRKGDARLEAALGIGDERAPAVTGEAFDVMTG